MVEGWLKLSRKINTHWIWKDPVKLKWWIDILLTVNYENNKTSIGYKVFECKRGQSLLSLQSWAKKWGVSKSVVNNFFNMLENDGMIVIENETVTTRLTVCNYDTYQQSENTINTDEERIENASRTQQSTIKERKEIKESKEVNTHESKEQIFKNEVLVFSGKYEEKMLHNFINYWTEWNPKKTKMKFEMQATFEISKRLVTWNSNQQKFDKNGTNSTNIKNNTSGFSRQGYDPNNGIKTTELQSTKNRPKIFSAESI